MFRLKKETGFKSDKTNKCNLDHEYTVHSAAVQGLLVEISLVPRPAGLRFIVINATRLLALAASPSPFKVM